MARRKPPRLWRIVRIRLHRLSRRLDRRTPEWMRWLMPWGTSLAVHGAALLILGLVYFVTDRGPRGTEIDAALPSQLLEDLDSTKESDHAGDPFTTIESVEPPSLAATIDPTAPSAVAEMPDMRLSDRLQTTAPPLESSDMADGLPRLPGPQSVVFSGRSQATRARLARREGGSVQSEAAVERGLDWLVRHQASDGHWSMDTDAQCQAPGCPHRKHMNTDTAGTGLALLPLLGAGQTHTLPGRYQKQVDDGLKWLIRAQKADGDLFIGGDGHMYSHAIGAMALGEAYGVTGDVSLRAPAQKAVDFIVKAQNRADGGWRYEPGEPGDTSVFGWQMFALRSAYLAGLDVPPDTIKRCRSYLDRAAADPQKSTYGYMPGQGASMVMTAEALLCRQYLGWPRQSPSLQTGASRVATDLLGGKERNLYYWYYGTQVLHNLEGPAWKLWNRKVRDQLVETQVRGKGCDIGSWDPVQPTVDRWGKDAGRLFTTSLSLLTLEVYYRYLPIYRARDANPVDSERPKL